MQKNVGTIDRVLRALIGACLIVVALVGESTASKFGWIGVIPLATAVVSFCPLYSLLGISTCPLKR